jgi:hypothetical protein
VTVVIAIVEFGGLAAAVLGVLFGLRGWWPEVIFCGAIVLSCAVVAAVWAPTEEGQLALTNDVSGRNNVA